MATLFNGQLMIHFVWRSFMAVKRKIIFDLSVYLIDFKPSCNQADGSYERVGDITWVCVDLKWQQLQSM